MNNQLFNCEGFEWDFGNSEKNWIRHQVMQGECEQVFFNEPVVVFADIKHSQVESRWFLLGKTDSERFLFVVFTIRENKIRIISARDMNKKEREVYNERT
ncbi:MAG: BrnT family toxin [Draconibacterium sp.]